MENRLLCFRWRGSETERNVMSSVSWEKQQFGYQTESVLAPFAAAQLCYATLAYIRCKVAKH